MHIDGKVFQRLHIGSGGKKPRQMRPGKWH
jgi:hypothetical protein